MTFIRSYTTFDYSSINGGVMQKNPGTVRAHDEAVYSKQLHIFSKWNSDNGRRSQ
jgi:hypothetical protein